MHKSFAIVPIIAVVLVQAQTPSSLIPSAISSSCTTFLEGLDSNPAITACTDAVIKATAAFGSAAKNSSSTQVTSALSALCVSSLTTTCSADLFAGQLAAFYAACSAELTANPNVDVGRMYDTLYNIQPFMTAICSLDDSGNSCATQAKLPPGTNAVALQNVLSTPSPSNSAALIPNTTTFGATDLAFLFLQNPVTSDDCNVCTRKIMTAYTTFEGQCQYAPGIAKSALLSVQPALYASINSVCGSTFLDQTGVVKAAGGLSGGTFSSGATHVKAGGLAVTGMGLLAIFASSVF